MLSRAWTETKRQRSFPPTFYFYTTYSFASPFPLKFHHHQSFLQRCIIIIIIIILLLLLLLLLSSSSYTTTHKNTIQINGREFAG
jgi:hypothetical protein